MKKSKIILPCSLIIFLFVTALRIYNFEYKYEEKNEVSGIVTKIESKENKISFIVKGEEKVLINDYDFISNVNLGDYVIIKGKSKLPSDNTNFNLFNYKNYLMSKNIYYTFTLEEITVKKNKSLLYSVKRKILDMIDSLDNDYIYTFILADNRINDETYASYQINGISHLFAVSGMHISLITTTLMFLLNKIIKNKKITSLFICFVLVFYMFLTGFQASVIRSSLMFILASIFRLFSIKVEPINLIILILIILLLVNPFYIYDIGFVYSFVISITLILLSKRIKEYDNYFLKLFYISFISFIISIPITVNHNFSINILSPILNLFFVPFVSYIIFPLSILTMFINNLMPILDILLSILEKVSILASDYKLEIIIPHMNLYMIIIYYLLVLLFFRSNKKIFLFFIVLMLLFYSNKKYFNNNYIVTMIDVGQGDSILMELPNNKANILIDTGGNKNYDISKNVIVPFLKSKGIKKINYIVLTHGDYDHMGSAINLVNNFKVEKVIFNCGKSNELEQELIVNLEKNKISYYSCIKELNVDNTKLYFLNNVIYNNENDNSNVIYTELNNHKFLFMGDAGIVVEEDIIEKYDLKDIEVLKVGHHGSKTSSSKVFIDSITPNYSIISVGKNNLYKHPNDIVLENLSSSNIYRTDIDGSIMFKIKNKELQIETCLP